MTETEIAGLLADYRDAKAEVRSLREEMIRFAVEDLGLDQSEASKMDMYAFLDGWLVGRGMTKSHRLSNLTEQAA